MPQKIKEEERIERIIRGLLKLPENRRCINCNSLGPQYVCTTFWTFVCTNCSGVHREFTHRVKSVSMARFSAEEVSALEAGGNQRAREIYFKAWDPIRNSYPDAGNIHRIRDFIKHVYLDRKYAGGRSNEKLSMIKADAKDDHQKRPSFESSSNGGREDFFESRSFRGTDYARINDFHSFENSIASRRNDDRSLRYYGQDKMIKSSTRSSRTPNFEIVDDRFREVRPSNVRTFGMHRSSSEDLRAQSCSPTSQRSSDKTNHPMIRPLKDILGEKAPPLKVGVHAPSQIQKAGSSSNPPAEKKKEETKTVNTLSSLIDFDDDLKTALTVTQSEETAAVADGGNISVSTARIDDISNNSNDNSLETLLFGLAGPVVDIPSVALSGLSNVSTDDLRMENTDVVPCNSSKTLAVVNQQPPEGVQSSAYPVENTSYTDQVSNTHEGSTKQSSISDPVSHTIASSEQSLQDAPKDDAQATTSANESATSGRRELPLDLFASSYSPFTASVPAWQSRPPYGMGYNTQYYPPSMAIGAPPDSVKSRNPFDIGDDSGAQPQAQGSMFPSMSSVQGALPNSSFSQGLQSAYASPQGSYEMMIHPGSYMDLQSQNDMHSSRAQVAGSFGGNDAFTSQNRIHLTAPAGGNNHDMVFASLYPTQHRSGGGNNHNNTFASFNPGAPQQPNSTRSGNPFG